MHSPLDQRVPVGGEHLRNCALQTQSRQAEVLHIGGHGGVRERRADVDDGPQQVVQVLAIDGQAEQPGIVVDQAPSDSILIRPTSKGLIQFRARTFLR